MNSGKIKTLRSKFNKECARLLQREGGTGFINCETQYWLATYQFSSSWSPDECHLDQSFSRLLGYKPRSRFKIWKCKRSGITQTILGKTKAGSTLLSDLKTFCKAQWSRSCGHAGRPVAPHGAWKETHSVSVDWFSTKARERVRGGPEDSQQMELG